jgi:hypothetical protein
MPFTFLRSRQLISANILDWGKSPNPCETLALSTDSCGSAEAELDYTWALFNNPKSCFCEMRKQKPNKFARKTTWATESQSAQILYLHVIMKFPGESNKGCIKKLKKARSQASRQIWNLSKIGEIGAMFDGLEEKGSIIYCFDAQKITAIVNCSGRAFHNSIRASPNFQKMTKFAKLPI